MAHFVHVSGAFDDSNEILCTVVCDGRNWGVFGSDDDLIDSINEAILDIGRTGDGKAMLRALLHGMPYHRFDGPHYLRGNAAAVTKKLSGG